MIMMGANRRRQGALLTAGAAGLAVAAALAMLVLRRWQMWPMCEHGVSAHGRPYISC